ERRPTKSEDPLALAIKGTHHENLVDVRNCARRPGRRPLRFGTADHDSRRPRLHDRHGHAQRQHRDVPRQSRQHHRHGDDAGEPDHLPQFPRFHGRDVVAMTMLLVALGLGLDPLAGWWLGAWLADLTYEEAL